MDDLPELPLEKMLSYLSLEDLIKSRAVSRRWHKTIDSFKVKSLCYSQRPSGCIFEQNRLIGPAFASSFFQSSSFERFFSTFGRSILSNLKKLRLCELRLNIRSRKTLAETLQSFGQLEELSIIRFRFLYDLKMKLKLNLPMLNSIHLEDLRSIEQLTLDAPRLQKVQLRDCRSLRLNIVHAESVERLDTDYLCAVAVKKFKNLKSLYAGDVAIDPTFLSDLDQLKEIHLTSRAFTWELLGQKQRFGRADLKIYICGYLYGAEDPAIHLLLRWSDQVPIDRLAENPSKLADKIPCYKWVRYAKIERVAPEFAISVLNRFTDLGRIEVDQPVQDIERFLYVLKNVDNIVELWFGCDQPQDLFDRLPEHCAVQKLTIGCRVRDFRFLHRLENLIHFYAPWTLSDIECIRKVLEELPFLSTFKFIYAGKLVAIVIKNPGRFKVSVNSMEMLVGDVNAVIQFVTNPNESQKKREVWQFKQYICDFTFSTNPDFIRSLYVHDRKLRVSGRLRKIEGVFNSKISRGAPDRNERAALR